MHEKAQIVVPLLANRGLFTLLPEDLTGKLCPMASGGFTLTLDESCKLKPQYVLGLLNSKLLFWKLQGISNIFRSGWITCTKQYLGALPIRLIDFNNPREKGCHDTIVELVDKIIGAKKSLLSAHTDKDKRIFERLCESLDRQIDNQVFDLYGVSDKEKQIIQDSK